MRAHKASVWCWNAIQPWIFTLVGIACLALYTKISQLAKLEPVRDLQIAVGSLVGTILTLAFSLSIIPLQKAAEVYSASILRLFQEDRGIRAVSLTLLAICFLSFGLTASPVLGIKPAATLPLILLLLGVSLDLLRRLYVLITRLLDPHEAVKRLSAQAHRKLTRLNGKIVRASHLLWQSSPPAEKNKRTPEQYLARYYEQDQTHDNFVWNQSVEFTEIAQKAMARNDWSLTFSTLNAMQRLAIDAIECRKSALVFYLADFMVAKATAEKPLNRVYEDLLVINRTAVRQGAENVSMMVIRTLGRIGEHMATVHRRKPQEYSAPLAPGPIWYCRLAIKESQGKGIDEARNEGSATLAKISLAAPVHTDVQDVHIWVIDGIFETISVRPASQNSAFYFREALSRALEVLHALVGHKDFQSGLMAEHFLRKLEAILPLGLALEGTEPLALMQHPIGPPYDASSDLSLVALVGRARNLIEPIRAHTGPVSWSHFTAFVESITKHFRLISEYPAIASSVLMFSLNLSVRQIAHCLLDESRRAREADSDSLEELQQLAGSLIHFYGSVAYHAKAMDLQRTREAAESLGILALQSLDYGLDELALTAAQNIASLGINGAKKLSNISLQHLASVLIPMRWIRRLAREMDRKNTLGRLNEIEQKLDAAFPEHTSMIAQLDELECEHWERISQGHPHPLISEVEHLLARLLGHRRRANDAAAQP